MPSDRRSFHGELRVNSERIDSIQVEPLSTCNGVWGLKCLSRPFAQVIC